ncbi:MAG: hypothetical protein HY924_11855 [Elusimicrobia bacterium]|nr:hypothetical protein [Elusimicrobiota bacterium]
MTSLVSILAAAAALSFAGQGPVGSTEFSYSGVRELKTLSLSVPVRPEAVPVFGQAAAGRIKDLHLLAQTGKEVVFSYAKTQAEADAFVSMWTPILAGAGFKLGQPSSEAGITVLPYSGRDGMMVREFLADPLQFKPKDEADRLASMAVVDKGLEDAGLAPFAAFLVDNEYILPTYAFYYATAKADKPEHEVQVRVLKKEGADRAVLERAGLKVLQQKEDFLTVYIGPEVGLVYRTGNTPDEIKTKVEEFKKFIAGQGGRFIEAKVSELEPGSYRKFAADIFFFQ